ncbi:MAG: GvpL/GvpF family gas vesicle protein [Chloroflexi bacterium]|nr:MAG: GvpL/GvpF family gas vesicle protein [Chloroflexota bacterium]
MSETLRYLYAITDARTAPLVAANELRGIEGAPVEPLVEGRLLAATSVVPASDYEEGPLNEHLQDLDWLAPRAAAHQGVNSRLLEITGVVLPLAFGAIYRGSDGVRSLLRSRAEELRDRLGSVDGRAEWIVSVERDEASAAASVALRELDAEIASAPPGRAFLLGKRRDEVLRDERRARDAAIAEGTAAAVEAIGERVYREPLIDDPTISAVARFSVLAELGREAELGAAVGRLGLTDISRGYRLRLSGPWPAYRFGGLPREHATPA